jgi:hypothetical protein
MTEELHQLVDALLYEGYLLYPYRSSALKNQRRYPLAALYPEPFCQAQQAGDRAFLQLQCLATGGRAARLGLQLRFLQLARPEPIPREVTCVDLSLPALSQQARSSTFVFGPLAGELFVRAEPVGDEVYELTVRVSNQTSMPDADGGSRDDALPRALVSPHLIAMITEGQLVSAIDPPEALRPLAERCRNVGTWPVLVGTPGRRNALLSAPIILYDYPRLAPESPGDFFDGTEIDELLTLRILTLTDDEKQEMAAADPRSRALLERTEHHGVGVLPSLHGARRGPPHVEPGTNVRLRPKGRADIFDTVLDGRRATVVGIERDLEGRVYVAVTIDDDPGKDLGAFGHRFFFWPDEVELL